MYSQSISENILFFISCLGMLQGLLLAALLYFHPKSDRSVNLFLSLQIVVLCLLLAIPFLVQLVTWQNGFFLSAISLFLGPFLYLYIRSFKEVITLRKVLPHLLFAVIYFLAAAPFVEEVNAPYANYKEVPAAVMRHPLMIGLFVLRLGQYFFYYFLSTRTLKIYRRSIRQLFSDTSRIDPAWIQWLTGGYLVLIIFSIVMYGLMQRFPEHFNLLLLCNVGINTPYIYLATYKGITQSTLWKSSPAAHRKTIEKELQQVSGTDSQKAEDKKQVIKQPDLAPRLNEIAAKVRRLMETGRMYQEPELTIQHLADKLQIPSYQISQAINEGMKKNFYDLVNSYRVEEAKRLLQSQDNRNYTILSVGFEAGFNSKTTFNTVFKKFTGLTPTEYRDTQKIMPALA